MNIENKINKNAPMWRISSKIKFQWVEKFKDIFINQKKDALSEIFNINNFGLHNAVSMENYCDYEFDEFSLKCDKFGLTMKASIECFDLKDDFFYFSLGKQEDKALFEAIFRWDEKTQLAIGNQYFFKIEPKTQFIKDFITGNTHTLRRINLKPNQDVSIKAIVQNEPGDDTILNCIDLAPHLGGRFYSFTYTRPNDNSKTYWDRIKVFSSIGIKTQDVLMRGSDHPLFQADLFPHINKTLDTVTIKNNIYPVVVYFLLEDGEEHFFKYPLDKQWSFDKKIKKVCLTDTLSFDWIVEANEK